MRTAALIAGMASILGLSGCATDMAQKAAAPVAASKASAKEFYVVLPENGRIYAFGDTKNYADFLAHSEVALTRTQIGAGPGGKTVVYGITKDDVKKNAPSLAEQIFQDKLDGAADFYGEAFKDGRYYVFGDLKDMKAFTAFGEVPYSYTDIGVGPAGETLVWVMNKDSYKKGRPAAAIERFKQMRASNK
ncbi:MAG: hypothetical protein A3I66_06065 [Burkholderiales bacterium RIFCSPLOWO2_02_FULL_57_36]|nr:MAG: hypothetical protein A3I66_06065 [Burkholderiales bacterium RIFCSPLOWO2_02_FULL_57_36]